MKLERTVVAAPHPCNGTSPSFWPQGNVNYHLVDSLVAWNGRPTLVGTGQLSKLFPYIQGPLTPGCSSADSVMRPSFSAILFITTRIKWRKRQPCDLCGVHMVGRCTEKRFISSLVTLLRFQKRESRSKQPVVVEEQLPELWHFHNKISSEKRKQRPEPNL